jgi:hypothetical protein
MAVRWLYTKGVLGFDSPTNTQNNGEPKWSVINHRRHACANNHSVSVDLVGGRGAQSVQNEELG